VDALGGLYTIHHRHFEVHQDHMGLGLGYYVQRVLAISGQSHDLYFRFGAQNRGQTFADNGLIIDNENAHHQSCSFPPLAFGQ
jgi:hypothetical protein